MILSQLGHEDFDDRSRLFDKPGLTVIALLGRSPFAGLVGVAGMSAEVGGPCF